METKSFPCPVTLLCAVLSLFGFAMLSLAHFLFPHAMAPEPQQPISIMEIIVWVVWFGFFCLALSLGCLLAVIAKKPIVDSYKNLADWKENLGPRLDKFAEDQSLEPEVRDNLVAKFAGLMDRAANLKSKIAYMNDDNDDILEEIYCAERKILKLGGQVTNPQGRRPRISHVGHMPPFDQYGGISRSALVRLFKRQNKEITALKHKISRQEEVVQDCENLVGRLEAQKLRLDKDYKDSDEMATALEEAQKAIQPRDEPTKKVKRVPRPFFKRLYTPVSPVASVASVPAVIPVAPITPVVDRTEEAELEVAVAPRRRPRPSVPRERLDTSRSPTREPAPVRRRSPAPDRRPHPAPAPTPAPTPAPAPEPAPPASPPQAQPAVDEQDVEMEDAVIIDPDSMDCLHGSVEMQELADEMEALTIECNAMDIDTEPSLVLAAEMEVDTESTGVAVAVAATVTSQAATGSSFLAAAAAAAAANVASPRPVIAPATSAMPVSSTPPVPVQQPAPVAMPIPGIGTPAATPAPFQFVAPAVPFLAFPAAPAPAPTPAPTPARGTVAFVAPAPDGDEDILTLESGQTAERPATAEHLFALAEEMRKEYIPNHLRELGISKKHIDIWQARHRMRLEEQIKEFAEKDKRLPPYSLKEVMTILELELSGMWKDRVRRENKEELYRSLRSARSREMARLLRQMI